MDSNGASDDGTIPSDDTHRNNDLGTQKKVRARLVITGRLLRCGYGAYLKLAAREHDVRGFGRFISDTSVLAYIRLPGEQLADFLEIVQIKSKSKELLTLSVDSIEVAKEPDVEYYRTEDGTIDSSKAPDDEAFVPFVFHYHPEKNADGSTYTQYELEQADIQQLLLVRMNMNIRGMHSILKEVVQTQDTGNRAVQKELERVRMGVKEMSGTIQTMSGELRRMRGVQKRRGKGPFDPMVG